jgi:hypothetical protein
MLTRPLVRLQLCACYGCGTRCGSQSNGRRPGRRSSVRRSKRSRRRQCRRGYATGNRKLGAIGGGLTSVLNLRRHGSRSRRAQRHEFLLSRPRRDTAAAAVIADPDVTGVYRIVINVTNSCDIHIRNGAVVVQSVVIPITAVVSVSGISEPVVNAAIETHVGSPISGVPPISAVRIAPIGRGPESSYPWRKYPCAWYPIIGGGRITPVSWRPVVIFTRAGRLAVFRQRRRRLRCLDRLLVRNIL